MKSPQKPNLKRFKSARNFYEHLKLALEFHHYPLLLAQHSPLAKPYFLYHHAPQAGGEEPESEEQWGKLLADQIDEAALELWGGELPTGAETLLEQVDETPENRTNRYHFLVLELNFFKRIYTPAPQKQAVIYNDILHIGRTTHDRHLREAIENLGKILLKRVRPTFRLEAPSLHSYLVERKVLTSTCLQALEAQRSISLVGSGGVGKTVAGTVIAYEWSSRSVFWFTIRPSFNDRLSSLLFAFGFFMHQQGASALWLQLVADGGKVTDFNLLLGLALADLEMLRRKPLVIIDEVDQLRSAAADWERPEQSQIRHFLESLRGHVALLLIGQQAVIETSDTLEVTEFGEAEIRSWLSDLQIPWTEKDLHHLMRYTQGNLRLVALCIALHLSSNVDENRPFADTMVRLPRAPGLVPIWDRLRRRLSGPERGLLQALAVFRSPAPRDAGPALLSTALVAKGESVESSEDVIESLVNRRLLLEDQAGSLAVPPALRQVIYEETLIERREFFHLQAATACATRGEITEASYHFGKANRFEEAISLWASHQEQEVQRGQAGAALTLFEELSLNRVQGKARRQLALIRGYLWRLVGDPDKAVENFEQVSWTVDDELSAEALAQWGKALEHQGNSLAAHQKSKEASERIAKLLRQGVDIHVHRGLAYLREREIQGAFREAAKAQFHSEMLQGAIQSELGAYEVARTHQQKALSLASELRDSELQARAHYYLAIGYMHQNLLEKAFHHYNSGIEAYRSGGYKLQEAELRSNLAGSHLVSGNYTECIELAGSTLSFFTRINSPYWCALNSHNISEAYFELGDFARAEEYALRTIDYEEAHFYPYGLYTLGSVRRAQSRLQEARDFYGESAQIAAENEDRFLLAHARRALGEVASALGNPSEAKLQLQEALLLFQQMQIESETAKTQELLLTLT